MHVTFCQAKNQPKGQADKTNCPPPLAQLARSSWSGVSSARLAPGNRCGIYPLECEKETNHRFVALRGDSRARSHRGKAARSYRHASADGHASVLMQTRHCKQNLQYVFTSNMVTSSSLNFGSTNDLRFAIVRPALSSKASRKRFSGCSA